METMLIEYNTDLKGTFLLLELIEWGQGLSLSAGTQVQVFLVTVKSRLEIFRPIHTLPYDGQGFAG